MNPTASPLDPPAGGEPLRKLTLIWILTVLVLFPVLLLLGGWMRSVQGGLIEDPSLPRFYSVLTLHGVGMVGVWFVAAMAGVAYCIGRYVRVSTAVNWIAWLGTATGVVMLLAATLVGQFGAGWYFLYPLPLKPLGAWPAWSAALFFGALAVFGLTWTVWCLDIARAIAKRYSLRAALGWDLIGGRTAHTEVPPLVLITLVSVIAALVGLLSAVVLLVLTLLELLGGAASDALLMKNLTFLFGHLLVNITLYLGVGLVYEILPHYSGRPWKNSRLVAIAWNCVLLLVIVAYFHHLYMDFVQLRWMQVVGQLASYLTSLPAAAMSIFGGLANVYRSRMKWTLASSLMFLGLLGWTIGGIGAVIDSTVVVNSVFHNTLWVPAHFHTYFLMGVTLMVLGVSYHLAESLSGLGAGGRKPVVAMLWLIGVGGLGFLLTFYISGAKSVPRRYAGYPSEVAEGIQLAKVSVVFVSVFLAGLLLYIWETGRRCVRALKACPPAP